MDAAAFDVNHFTQIRPLTLSAITSTVASLHTSQKDVCYQSETAGHSRAQYVLAVLLSLARPTCSNQAVVPVFAG